MPSGNYMILEPIERLKLKASRFVAAAAIVISAVVFLLLFLFDVNFVAIEMSTSFCDAGVFCYVLFCFIYDLVMMMLGFLYECIK